MHLVVSVWLSVWFLWRCSTNVEFLKSWTLTMLGKVVLVWAIHNVGKTQRKHRMDRKALVDKYGAAAEGWLYGVHPEAQVGNVEEAFLYAYLGTCNGGGRLPKEADWLATCPTGGVYVYRGNP